MLLLVLVGGVLSGLPTIRILGSNPAKLVVGHRYHDAGATCSEGGRDLARNLEAIATVLPFKVGVYHVQYFCRDKHGQRATAQRAVHVINASQSRESSKRYAYSHDALLRAIADDHAWPTATAAAAASAHAPKTLTPQQHKLQLAQQARQAQQVHWAQQARAAPLTAMLVLCRVPASAVEAAESPTRHALGVAVARALGGWSNHIPAATVVLGARWSLHGSGGRGGGNGGGLARAVHDAGLRACSNDGAWANEHPTSVAWVQIQHGLDGRGRAIAPRLRSAAFGAALARAFIASGDPVLRAAGKILPGAPRAAGVVAAIRHSAVVHEAHAAAAAPTPPAVRGAMSAGVVPPPASSHARGGNRAQARARPLHALERSGRTSTAAPKETARLGVERLAFGTVVLVAVVFGSAWRRTKSSVQERLVEEQSETGNHSSAHAAAATAAEESHALLA